MSHSFNKFKKIDNMIKTVKKENAIHKRKFFKSCKSRGRRIHRRRLFFHLFKRTHVTLARKLRKNTGLFESSISAVKNINITSHSLFSSAATVSLTDFRWFDGPNFWREEYFGTNNTTKHRDLDGDCKTERQYFSLKLF